MADKNAEPAPVGATAQLVGRYYRGVICKLHRGPERGRVRSGDGREIPFIYQHVTILGVKNHFADLKEGMEVGYDVSWTGKGLRVSIIRMLDESLADQERSERQLGSEEDEVSHHFTDEDS